LNEAAIAALKLVARQGVVTGALTVDGVFGIIGQVQSDKRWHLGQRDLETTPLGQQHNFLQS